MDYRAALAKTHVSQPLPYANVMPFTADEDRLQHAAHERVRQNAADLTSALMAAMWKMENKLKQV